MSKTAQVLPLFETPLIVDNVPGASQLNAVLLETIRSRRLIDAGVEKSNWLGWQSNVDMMTWGGEAAQRLGHYFAELCNRFTWNPYAEAVQVKWRVDMWANVSGPNAANESHVHPGTNWSAVYYVDDGYEGSADPALGGELALYDPRMPAVRMVPLDLRYRRPDGQVAQSQTYMRPVAGRIVMFPPWLYHAVRPYRGKKERVSIAMNAIATS